MVVYFKQLASRKPSSAPIWRRSAASWAWHTKQERTDKCWLKCHLTSTDIIPGAPKHTADSAACCWAKTHTFSMSVGSDHRSPTDPAHPDDSARTHRRSDTGDVAIRSESAPHSRHAWGRNSQQQTTNPPDKKLRWQRPCETFSTAVLRRFRSTRTCDNVHTWSHPFTPKNPPFTCFTMRC